ncbi:MAG: MFS transporter [Chloroflexi bacterium]|nr:MFS transporter [Chloroflexota bacterium]
MTLPNGIPPQGAIVPKKKPRIFYGWWIVIASVFLNIVFGGILFYGFTLVIDPITEEMNWTKTQITGAYLFMGLGIGILAPLLGWMFDKVGPRPLLAFGLTGLGFSLIMLHSVDSLIWFYLWFSLANASSVGMWMAVGPAVANWFVRMRGRAVGIYSLGFAFAGFMAPPFLWLVDGVDYGWLVFAGVGWRDAFFIAGIVFLIMMPIAVLIIRHRPEDIGLYPDGADEPPAETTMSSGAAVSDDVEVNSTASQALRTSAFWLLAVASAFGFLAIATLQVHWVPYLGSTGFTRETAAFYLTLLPLSTVMGRLTFGFLADFMDKRRVTALAFGVQACAVFTLAWVDESRQWSIFLFLGFWGFGFGGTVVTRMALQGFLFGRNSFGALQGALSMTSEAGFALAPFIASLVFEGMGTYRPAFLAFAFLCFMSVPLTLLIRRPGLAARGFVPAIRTDDDVEEAPDEEPAPATRAP